MRYPSNGAEVGLVSINNGEVVPDTTKMADV